MSCDVFDMPKFASDPLVVRGRERFLAEADRLREEMLARFYECEQYEAEMHNCPGS